MAGPGYDIRYDRRVTPDFLAHFCPGGVADRLRVIAHRAALPLDLQFRKDPRTGRQKATLYAGLTAVLNVQAAGTGLRLNAHKTWSENPAYGFGEDWGKSMPPYRMAEQWEEIELYLERVIPPAVRQHGMTEGAVQAVASKSVAGGWAVLDREALPAYRDAAYKKECITACGETLLNPVWAPTRPFPKTPAKLGTECDIVALDPTGRLLAVEVKPLGGAIAWVPMQGRDVRVTDASVDHGRPGDGPGRSHTAAGPGGNAQPASAARARPRVPCHRARRH